MDKSKIHITMANCPEIQSQRTGERSLGHKNWKAAGNSQSRDIRIGKQQVIRNPAE